MKRSVDFELKFSFVKISESVPRMIMSSTESHHAPFHATIFLLFTPMAQKPLLDKSSHPEVFLRKGVLKICSKFTGKHPCRSGISIKLQSSFIEIALRHGCSPVNLLHIFRKLFLGTPLGGCF